MLLLVEHLHEIGDRLLIQSGRIGGGPETVVANLAAQPGERLSVSGGGDADLEPDGQGTLSGLAFDAFWPVTGIVTKTPRYGQDKVRQNETPRRRQLRPARASATGRDGLGRGSACS